MVLERRIKTTLWKTVQSSNQWIQKIQKGAREYDEAERKKTKKQKTDVDEILLSELLVVSIDDEEKLKNLWTKTFDIRDRGTSIGECFERFPHLKAPFGAKLVSKYS